MHELSAEGRGTLILPCEELEIGGVRAMRLDMREPELGQRRMQVMFFAEDAEAGGGFWGYTYLVLCRAPEEEFDTYADTFQEIVSSFRLLE